MERLIKFLLIFLAILLFTDSARARIGVPGFESHLVRVPHIVVGDFKIKDNKALFVVDKVLKGNLMEDKNIIIDRHSRLAWEMHEFAPGVFAKPDEDQFFKRIQQKPWFLKKAILLGRMQDGYWVSFRYDWSVWTSGESTNITPEGNYTELSIQELIPVIEKKVAELKDSSSAFRNVHEFDSYLNDDELSSERSQGLTQSQKGTTYSSQSIEENKKRVIISAHIDKNNNLNVSGSRDEQEIDLKKTDEENPSRRSWVIGGLLLAGVLVVFGKIWKTARQ